MVSTEKGLVKQKDWSGWASRVGGQSARQEFIDHRTERRQENR